MTQNPKVHLRALEPEDLELLYRIENDVKLWNVGTSNVPYSRWTLHEYIANSTGDIYTDRQVRMMIENDAKEVVGIIDLVNFDASNRKAELGLIIEEPFRRAGYAQSALEKISGYAVTVLHLHQLFATIDVTNEPCLKLFRRLGFIESAKLKDWLFDGRNYHDALVMQRIL
ncbi:MAG: GNAT family N-acetyltransferase [Prevotella sp.]|jgi:diamine N-acetyltransferase|nr:GNAT family N-acetyltransferase [Prevotella sp.]